MTTVLVGDLCKQIRGVSYSKGDAIDRPQTGYIPVLRANNIADGELDLTDLVYVPESKVRDIQRLKEGDVLVAASSGSLSVVGKAATVRKDVVAGFGAFCKVLRPSNKVHPAYFAHYFQTASYRYKVSNLAAGANINNLKNEHLDELPFSLPPLEQQKRIAAILDKADELRAKRRRAIAKLDELLKSVFLELFGDPVTNPKGWPIKQLGNIAGVKGGLQVTSKRHNNGIKVPYLRVANVYRDRLELGEIKTIQVTESELERTQLSRGDLLIVEGHGNRDEIGRSAVWDDSIKPCVHQNHLIRVQLDNSRVLPDYTSFYLNSDGGRRQLTRSGKTTSGLNTISTSNVRQTQILLPPLEEQQRFIKVVRFVNAFKNQSGEQLKVLDALFSSLQARAFSGDLTPDTLDQVEAVASDAVQESLF